MAKWEEATRLLKCGLGPIEIASEKERSIKTVIPYLFIAVGHGRISLSDIFFSIPLDRRQVYQDARELDPNKRRALFRRKGLDEEEYKVFWRCYHAVTGDIYRHLRDIEVTLHIVIRCVLEHVYRAHDDLWWEEGIPLNIRQSCTQRREEDPKRREHEPYEYTTLIHLKEIIDKKWKIFGDVLPVELGKNKREVMSQLQRLNEVRNVIMHPVKRMEPDEESFEFVRDFANAIAVGNWRFASG